MLDLTQYGVRTELVSRAPGFHQGLFGPNKFWTALKSSACFLAKKERCFFRRTTEVLDHNEICILHPYVDLIAWESERDTKTVLEKFKNSICFFYNLIPEDILIEKSAKKTLRAV